MKIVLVNLFNHQDYIEDNIVNLHRFNNNEIVVITDEKFIHKFKSPVIALAIESLIPDYKEFTHLITNSFRNGFWQLATYRFRALLAYMKKYDVENIIHLENDVMVFENLDNIPFHNSNKILLTMDCPTRCIPSIMFIPNHKVLEKCMSCFQPKKNDMENWAISFNINKNDIDTLPIGLDDTLDSCKNHANYGAVFDAAAIGQYLGGIDPRNTTPGNVTIGFVNETCCIDYSKFSFLWKPNRDNLMVPYMVVHNKEYPVINLHVHSKNLKQFIIGTKNPPFLSTYL